ncbi:NAD(P)-dependent oxidoreductase [Xanthomonas sacchari]|uniref:NAD(P)-dependent oxidoreductase n=2 Tax=Xanthomonas sacchari TaxID=56458 RepID=A0AA46SYP0_9XANT|nr:NAD(P)-dependent oxidoreductase [Xanthomonas sacchari]UYK91008.1 NAD(P)-dependent oxidoreductase [Xanthomonas sacchari]
MGQPIALNLLRAGHALTVWNRSAAAAQPLLEAGAQQAAQPADAVRGPVLFSMLADDTAVRETLLDRGALDALTAGSVHVNMATISVTLARELHALHAERGVVYLAMPVLGRVEVAAAGQLNLLAAGDAAALARVQPLLDVIGRKTWYFGAAPEQANAVKLAANLCLASAIGTMAEASALVRGHGVEAAEFLDMLTSTVFAAPAYQTYGGMIAEQRYSPAGFKATLGLKDVRLALNAGETRHVPMPLAAVLRDAFIEAIAHGDGDLDWAALAKVAARRAGQA